MEIVRFADRRARPAVSTGVGVLDERGIVPIADSIAEVLRLPSRRIREVVEATAGADSGRVVPLESALLLPPLDGRTEVWAAGVTYERSRSARVEESAQASVYDLVYTAERPELFSKAPAWRVVTDGEPIGIRADSGLDVPEPELGLVVNAAAEIVGYVVVNDVSSRAIEGENPLYLPQAKVYAGSCAVGSRIRPAWTVDASDLPITLTVHRDGAPVWRGDSSTARMRRRPAELVEHLFAGDRFPDGVVLATGTGVIPELTFTLGAGDRVEIEIGGVGTLTNPVVVGKEPLAWLEAADNDPYVREAVRR